ncbi:MAG: VIT1/CCC1 transporter family protein [Alphaproteobacteria bacterium]
MSQHDEQHIESSPALRDSVIGMADGLTVPFALAAGLSGVIDSTGLIVTAGAAEIAAGAIAMGLGGYLAAKTEAEHYASELARERQEIKDIPEQEAREVVGILEQYGLDAAQAEVVVGGLRQNPERWVNFMMRFELGLEKPDPRRVMRSPLTIGTAYIVGGLIPLLPYIYLHDVQDALVVSAGMTLLALLLFGGAKGYFTGVPIVRAALQTMAIGAAAAAAAFGLATALG